MKKTKRNYQHFYDDITIENDFDRNNVNFWDKQADI